MHTTLVRNLAILVFAGLVVVCVFQLKEYRELPEGQQAARNLTLAAYFLLTAVVGGFFFVAYVLPKFGDAVGEAMLSSSEQVGTDLYLKARGKVAIGDYEGAVAEYRAIARENPDDRLPIAEIVKLYLERLHDPANAELVLENAIRDDHWKPDDAAFFIFRLVDLVQEYQPDDKDRAVNLLQKAMRRYPNSRHAANATHRLRQIDPALVKSIQAEIAAEESAAEAAGRDEEVYLGKETQAAADHRDTAPAAAPSPSVLPPDAKPPTAQEPPKPNV